MGACDFILTLWYRTVLSLNYGTPQKQDNEHVANGPKQRSDCLRLHFQYIILSNHFLLLLH